MKTVLTVAATGQVPAATAIFTLPLVDAVSSLRYYTSNRHSMPRMNFSKHFQKVKEAAKVAFAVDAVDRPLTAVELALLEKIAAAVAHRRLSGPALLLLESAGPMNFLGSQALHVLTPILSLACDARDLEQAAMLLERRDAIPRLIALIEARTASGTPLPQ